MTSLPKRVWSFYILNSINLDHVCKWYMLSRMMIYDDISLCLFWDEVLISLSDDNFQNIFCPLTLKFEYRLSFHLRTSWSEHELCSFTPVIGCVGNWAWLIQEGAQTLLAIVAKLNFNWSVCPASRTSVASILQSNSEPCCRSELTMISSDV